MQKEKTPRVDAAAPSAASAAAATRVAAPPLAVLLALLLPLLLIALLLLALLLAPVATLAARRYEAGGSRPRLSTINSVNQLLCINSCEGATATACYSSVASNELAVRHKEPMGSRALALRSCSAPPRAPRRTAPRRRRL